MGRIEYKHVSYGAKINISNGAIESVKLGELEFEQPDIQSLKECHAYIATGKCACMETGIHQCHPRYSFRAGA